MISTDVVTAQGGAAREERSVGELFSELASETATLVRQEVKLATTETGQKVSHAGKQLGIIATGALIGAVALQTLLGALVLALAPIVDLWKAALLVGLVVAAIAYVLVTKGLSALRKMDLVPKQTLQSINEDKSWLQQQVR